MRIYYYVKCERCGLIEGAEQDKESVIVGPPRRWQTREVLTAWAMGAAPSGVLLCVNCAQHVDARMGAAWHDAVERQPSAPSPPEKQASASDKRNG